MMGLEDVPGPATEPPDKGFQRRSLLARGPADAGSFPTALYGRLISIRPGSHSFHIPRRRFGRPRKGVALGIAEK